jgi:uncharacterized protein
VKGCRQRVESPMTTFTQPEPLTDAELDRLGDFLEGCKTGKAMNVEELDGFFAALIAGPETVMPSEYNRELFGGETPEFSNLEEAKEILELLMRHWNTIAGTLLKGEVYVPLLLRDDDGMTHGNDWADGFMRGMHMRHDGWAELMDDEEHGGCIVPMMLLYQKHDQDPKMRPKPITAEQREDVIMRMAAGLVSAYRYFRSQGKSYADTAPASQRGRNTPKVGRNDLCPCGSGKKYKRCCGGVTVN